MASLSYGRIFCIESQKIDGTYQRYNHYFRQIFIIYKYIKYSVPSIFETQGRKYGRNLSWSCLISNVFFYSSFSTNKIQSVKPLGSKRTYLLNLGIIFSYRNLNRLSLKCQSYSKVKKKEIDAF